MNQFQFPFAVALISFTAPLKATSVLAPKQDVMTSGFFTAGDFVRGYSGETRPTFRVSNDGAFGVAGAETIYLSFDSAEISTFSSPVTSAFLTVTSKSGGFNGDAGAGNPFLVSAHGVDTDPLTAITDDTNTSGTVDWLTFYTDRILASDPVSSTSVDSFGAVIFDVTPLVNDWISGANSEYTIALTGKNDPTGNDFLHGFENNSETPGSSFLTITTIPEPSSIVLSILAIALGLGARRRNFSN